VAKTKATELMICVDGDGDSHYLVSNPNFICWTGDHVVLMGINSVAILTYYVLFPGFYFYLLFVMVPRRPLAHNDPKLVANFGFVWSRFEDEEYWWEVRRRCLPAAGCVRSVCGGRERLAGDPRLRR
jgi:hypothetical protein